MDGKGRLKMLSPIREFIRRVYPPSHSLSRPLGTYFQELLGVWNSRRQLPSGTLASDLVAQLGNINELILEGLMTEDKFALTQMGNTIITLNSFSTTMLMGESPLLQKLPALIKVTGDAALRWKYTCIILLDPDYHYLSKDPEALIEEGVQYFNEGTHPTRTGAVISALKCPYTNC
jgi:hypothetical protein